MNELKQTRENVIDIVYALGALMRKAQCRAISGDIIDAMEDARMKLFNVDIQITKIIGD